MLYETGAAIGFTPLEVNKLTISEFNSSVKGYVKANSQKDDKKFSSDEEMDDVFNWLTSQEEQKVQFLKNNVYIWDGSHFELLKQVSFEVK